MGYFKELTIDYEELFECSYSELTENDFFKAKIKGIPPAETPNPVLQEFYRDILPTNKGLRYWIMAKDGDLRYNKHFFTLDNLIAFSSSYINYDYDWFYIPAQFKGWRTDENARNIKSLYVDIDGITDVDLLHMNTTELRNWLMDTYQLSEDSLPNYALCSGHGLHLYYIISELDLGTFADGYTRDCYIDYLMYYFHSDPACRNRSHILRIPLSGNMKHGTKIPTVLHHTNTSTNHDIHRLDFMIADYKTIEEYKTSAWAKTTQKRLETRAKNTALNLENASHKHTVSQKKKKPKSLITACSTAMEYRYEYRKNARAWNTVLDLHNYFCRHGCDIAGHRHLFTHILTVLLYKCNYKENEIKDFILPYFACDYRRLSLELKVAFRVDDFKKEAIDTIERTLASVEKYNYKNSTIALLLGFTPEDYANSYCCYTEQQKKERKKQTNKAASKRYYEKKAAQKQLTPRQKKAAYNYEYVKKHPEMTKGELANILDVSVDTIKRIRRKLRTNHNS